MTITLHIYLGFVASGLTLRALDYLLQSWLVRRRMKKVDEQLGAWLDQHAEKEAKRQAARMEEIWAERERAN